MLKLSNVFKRNVDAYASGQYRYLINQGGTSSTKTFSILQMLFEIARKHNKQIDIIGQTSTHLRSGVLKDMPMVANQFGYEWDKRFKTSIKEYKHDVGQINFWSFDKLGKAHGGRRDILFLNEANHIHFSIAEQLMVRTRDLIIIDYNPTNEFWVQSKILKEEADKCLLIKSTYKDNPFLEQSIIDSIESKKGNNNFWRVYGLGELGISEGLVFENFEQKNFDKNNFGKYLHGIDWGFSNDPFAYIRCAIEKNCLYICDEIYLKGLLNKPASELVKPILLKDTVFCDSAEPKSVQEFLSYGIDARSVKKGQGSVESGIKFIQSFDKVYIHPSCPYTYTEFNNYQWKQDKNGEYMPQPIDAFNHAIDAIRYALENEMQYHRTKVIGLRPF